MNFVFMQHPDLPGQTIAVDELAVPHHAAAGWEQVPADTPADPAPAPEPAPAPAPGAARRRAPKEADEK
jgi:hypothetical protein